MSPDVMTMRGRCENQIVNQVAEPCGLSRRVGRWGSLHAASPRSFSPSPSSLPLSIVRTTAAAPSLVRRLRQKNGGGKKRISFARRSRILRTNRLCARLLKHHKGGFYSSVLKEISTKSDLPEDKTEPNLIFQNFEGGHRV